MSAIENILGMLPDRVGDGKNSQIYTPPHIAQEMINALPEDIWNKDTTFLDICCKSGIFLYKIYQKLMESHSMQAAFPDETDRATHIVHKQLFGIAPNLFCKMFSTRTVYGYLDPDSHIISFGDNYNHVMQNPDRRFLIETLKKEFNIVKFDVVIGNPPYNRGMDLDFVDLGYKLSNKYTCMITPAKWQTAEADQKIASEMSYGEFRKQIVPHMRYVCFYPDSRDVFDIKQLDGITWFILDKAENSTAFVENKCVRQALFNGSESRSIHNRESLINVGNEIVQFIWKQKPNRYYFSILPNGNHEVYIVDAMCNPGKNIVDTTGKTLLFSPMEIISYNDGFKNLSDNAKLKEIDPDARFDVLEPLANEDGVVRSFCYAKDWPDDQLVISSQTKYPERILEMVNWLYTEEGRMASNFGLEGRDYAIAEDGSIVTNQELIDAQQGAADVACAVRGSMGLGHLGLARSVDTALDRQLTPNMYAMGDRIAQWKEEGKVEDLPLWPPLTEEETEKVTDIESRLDNLFSQNIDAFIMGKKSMDQWPDFVEQLKAQKK